MPTVDELALPADGTVNWGPPMRGSVLTLNKAFEDYKATDTGGGGGTGDSALVDAMANLARIDAVMTSLDTRENIAINWAVAADSIGDAATEWAEKGVKDFAALMSADRPAGFRRWNAVNNTLGAYNQWQAGVGTGTIGTPGNYVILNDEFNRGGASTAIEASGATPDTGNGNWQGPTGRWRIYNNSVLEIVPGVTPVLTDVLYALTQPHDTDAINVNAQSLHRLSSNASSAVTTQTALMGTANKTGIYHEVIASSASVTANLVIKTSAGSRTIAFPTGGMPTGNADNFPIMTLTIAGTSVSATFGTSGNVKTVTTTLTSAEVSALLNWDRVWTSTSDARFRMDNINVSATATPNSSVSNLPALTLYNGSVAGSKIAVQLANMVAMYPVAPDLLFISHSMNYEEMNGPDFMALVQEFVDKMEARFGKRIPVIFLGENPRFLIAGSGTPATRIPSHAARVRYARAYCRKKGWPYIAAFEAFSKRQDGGLGLMESDGIHPKQEDGAALMASLVTQMLVSLSLRPR